MTQFRSTLVFGALIAGVIGYTVYDYKREERESAAKAEAERVLTIGEADISRIKVVRPAETMVLTKEGAQWRIIEPLEDEVESEAANVYINSIGMEKATPIVKDKPGPFEWRQYNLEPPGAAIEITKADGAVVSFSVSRLAAFDGSYFVRKGDQLLLGTQAWAKIIEKGANQLRSKKVLRRSGKAAKIRIEISHPELKDKFTLAGKGEGGWSIVEAPGLVLDSGKVSAFVEELNQLRALDFQTEMPDAAARKRYSINPVMAKISIEFEKQDPAVPAWQMEIGADKDGAHYGVSSSVNAVFKLSAHDGEQLRRSRNSFRDGREPFKLATMDTKEIRVKADRTEWTFAKDDAGWKVADKADAKANSENLEKMIEKLSGLEAKDYLPGAMAAKANIRREVEFRGEGGKALLRLGFGDEFTPASGPNKNQQMVYARSSLTKELLAVSATEVREILFDQLATAETKTQQSEQR